MQKKTFVVMFILFLSALVAHAAAQDASVTNEDEERLRQAITSYVTAFNAQDAKTMAQHWSADGVYVSNVSGEEVVGREAIAAELAEIFSGEAKRQLTVVTESIELLSPNVAIENRDRDCRAGRSTEVRNRLPRHVCRARRQMADRSDHRKRVAASGSALPASQRTGVDYRRVGGSGRRSHDPL